MTKAQRNIIIILAAAILILGGFAYWLSTYPSATNVFYQREMAQIQTQSSSDEIEMIEKDLLDTDLSNLDQELEAIEKELDAAY